MNQAVETITLDGADRAGCFQQWQALLQQSALSAHRFELHCWEDEEAAIALALTLGREERRDWPRGRVFTGAVTPVLIQTLLTQPLPKEEERLTPFFSIFFDNGFSSEHYGTEIYICEEEPSR